jgi:hypothetical protein
VLVFAASAVRAEGIAPEGSVPAAPSPIRASIDRIRFGHVDPQRFIAPAPSKHQNSIPTKISAAVAMSVLGAIAGKMVGWPLAYASGSAAPYYMGVYGGAIGGAIGGVWLTSQ